MVCSLMKKAVAGAALGVAALWLVSGTPAYNYVRTVWQSKMNCIKQSIPVDMQVASLKQQLVELETLMHSQIQNVARGEQEVKDLNVSLARNKVALLESGKKIVALRETIPAADVQLTSSGAPRDQVLRDLKSRMSQHSVLESTVNSQESTLAKTDQALTNAKAQLSGLKGKKQELISRLDAIAAQARANQAAQQGALPGLDTSALTEIEKQVNDLEKQIKLESRTIELSQQYLGVPEAAPTSTPESSDVLGEIDAKFGKAPKAEDKSL